MPVMRKTEAR